MLNGGGSWPAQNKHAVVGDWLALAEAYHQASMSTDAKVQVPVIWGTDAVHGNSNVPVSYTHLDVYKRQAAAMSSLAAKIAVGGSSRSSNWLAAPIPDSKENSPSATRVSS